MSLFLFFFSLVCLQFLQTSETIYFAACELVSGLLLTRGERKKIGMTPLSRDEMSFDPRESCSFLYRDLIPLAGLIYGVSRCFLELFV